MNRKIALIGALIMASTIFSACSNLSSNEQAKTKFENTDIKYQNSWSKVWSIAKAYWRDNRTDATPKADIPVLPLSISDLNKTTEDIAVRLGHSTVLLKIDGDFILLDPVFSERVFAVQWLGPKRFHQSPISIKELPPIKAVIISHDHYDHLDKNAIQALAEKTERFVTPLNVGKHLKDWGIDANKVTELNWWETTTIDQIKLTATPSQHFSGRGLFDRDETLWASWVIQGWDSNIFFTGDSGYFAGFKEIGEKYGPFDLTLVETGAYNDLWADIHMLPEQSLQAHIDLKGKAMMPVHNGTFDLSLHNWFEPLEMITNLAIENDVRLITPKFGEIVSIKQPLPSEKWWTLNGIKAEVVFSGLE
ncbi:hydrolase [Psychrosphaera haliotis]|uniref:Hydrolase n=2 Tax=Psychrosphaera haliotis TaxID=555083 RepID=A0A6N8FAR6_9GAMM|nr:hydrolase [Psychrosphaera haliotis]